MIVGAAFVIAASTLLMYNNREDSLAGDAAEDVLEQVRRALPEIVPEDLEVDEDVFVLPEKYKADVFLPGEEELEEKKEMTVRTIDGHGYIGFILIPRFDLELPIMAEWDYDKLRIAPCRQFGSTKTDDLVIAGHNYKSHFGNIPNLNRGDIVIFTDMDNEVSSYAVESVVKIGPNDTDLVLYSDYDLILYTCDYGGRNRFTVNCRRYDRSGADQ